MDVRFAGQRAQRLLRRALGVGRSIVGERGAALIVRVVRRLALAQARRCGLIALAAEVAARRERRYGLAVFRDTLLRRRMAREQRRESAALAAVFLRQPYERLLQRDGRIRVVACGGHVAHAVM